MLVEEQPARAALCPERGIFWHMTDAAGDPVTAYGAWNDITLSQKTLTCVTAGIGDEGNSGTGHTARILLGGQINNWVEVGVMELICGNGNKCQRAFFSYGLVGAQGFQTRHAFGCLNPGTRHTWTVERGIGTTDWFGYLRCYTTGSWAVVDSATDVLFQNGFAEGEGFERGLDSTWPQWQDEGVMSETHSNLQWQAAVNGPWQPSQGVQCRRDNSYRWDGRQLSPMSFDIYQNPHDPPNLSPCST